MKFRRSRKAKRRIRAAKAAKRAVLTAAILAMTGSPAVGQQPNGRAPSKSANAKAALSKSEPPKSAAGTIPSHLDLPLAPVVKAGYGMPYPSDNSPQATGSISEKNQSPAQAVGILGLMNRGNAGPGRASPTSRPRGAVPGQRRAGRSQNGETTESKRDPIASSMGSLMIDVPLPPGMSPTTNQAPDKTSTDASQSAQPSGSRRANTELSHEQKKPPQGSDSSTSGAKQSSDDTQVAAKTAADKSPQLLKRGKKMRLSISGPAPMKSAAGKADIQQLPDSEADKGQGSVFHLSDDSSQPGSALGEPSEHDATATAAKVAKGMLVRVEGTSSVSAKPVVSGVVGAPVPTFESELDEPKRPATAASRTRPTQSTAEVVRRGSRQSLRLNATASPRSSTVRKEARESGESSRQPATPPILAYPLEIATPAILGGKTVPEKLPNDVNHPAARLAKPELRSGNQSSSQIVAQKPEDSEPTPAVFQSATTGEALVLDPQQSSSLTMNSRIIQCSAEHPTICQLIKTSDNSISLIGISDGKTRIAIVTADRDGQPTVEVREVKVGTPGRQQPDLQLLADGMTKTIGSLYPTSQVEILADGQQLIVQGIVSSESEARKVISLIRKTALTPVIDRLQSSER